MSHPATRIGHVSKAARNYVNMKVGNGLACRWALVESYIEAID